MKVWITRYALTSGIFEMEAEQGVSPTMVCGRRGAYAEYYHGEGKDWHLDKASAIARAEKMRDNKIKSMRKQIDKLSDMVWS